MQEVRTKNRQFASFSESKELSIDFYKMVSLYLVLAEA